MKTFVASLSLFLIVISFGIKLIAIMSYSNFDEWLKNRDLLLNSKNASERFLAKIFYAYIDGRWVLAGLGILGLLISLIVL